jgi:hypothetical protein
MKRLTWTLVILIIAAGAVFYFGWVQLRAPADTYGVIFTKTNGFERNVVRPGEFAWRWQALLPTNLTLYSYTLAPQTTDVQASGSLPSADLYSQFLDGHPDFSYALDFTVTYELKPESLPELTARRDLTPKTVSDWYSAFSAQCRAAALTFLASQDTSLADTSPDALQSSLKVRLTSAFPLVTILDVSTSSAHIPDIALYQKGKQLYLNVINAEQTAREEAAVNKANLDSDADEKIALLKKYGDLFNQYPVLLKYLDIDPAKRQGVIPGF